MNISKRIASAVIASGAIFLSACTDSDSTQEGVQEGERIAVIAGVSPDFTSSEVSLAEAAAPYQILEGYGSQAISDISVATNGDYFYRISKFGSDNISRFGFETPSLGDWQFTTDDDANSSTNPYDIIFVSDEKAYVIRYGASSILIINPSVAASDEDNFQIGTIDLSAYDPDGIPDMAAALIHDGVLYVALQALDASYVPGTAYLVGIDVATDTEIDLDADGGTVLTVKNPVDIDLADNSLFVAGVGRYASSWGTPRPAEYTGGIEKISLTDFSTSVLVDDGNDTTHPYGNIDLMEIISDTQGYFRGAASYGVSSLYEFNPTTGVVNGTPVAGLQDLDITEIAYSPEGLLWVGIGSYSEPEIRIIDPSDQSQVDAIPMTMNPKTIKFSDDLSELFGLFETETE